VPPSWAIISLAARRALRLSPRPQEPIGNGLCARLLYSYAGDVCATWLGRGVPRHCRRRDRLPGSDDLASRARYSAGTHQDLRKPGTVLEVLDPISIDNARARDALLLGKAPRAFTVGNDGVFELLRCLAEAQLYESRVRRAQLRLDVCPYPR
jgi:hypothetical protein